MYTGLLIGFLFAFLMKRSRLCFAGSLRDIYMKKKYDGIKFIFIIFSLQGLCYFTFLTFGIIPKNEEVQTFSLFATILGSFLFGLGAVFANGCSVSMLIKAGDSRLNGLVALLSFLITVFSAKSGLLSIIVKKAKTVGRISDNYSNECFNYFIYLYLILAIVAVYIVVKEIRKPNKLSSIDFPSEFTGIRHILFEKIYNKYMVVLILGILAGVSFYLSHITGREGSWGITTPLYTWANLILTGENKLNWASFFVLGIILGGFVVGKLSNEWRLKVGDAKSVLYQVIGGFLLAFGAVMAEGCIVGFAMTGLAMFSLQALIGVISIVLGIWFGAYMLYKRK